MVWCQLRVMLAVAAIGVGKAVLYRYGDMAPDVGTGGKGAFAAGDDHGRLQPMLFVGIELPGAHHPSSVHELVVQGIELLQPTLGRFQTVMTPTFCPASTRGTCVPWFPGIRPSLSSC